MSYYPPDCQCLGTSCSAPYNQPLPVRAPREAPDILGRMIAATNPFNRIEDREAELRQRMKTR